ncbi:T9SS type A sorting domain-containing protein [Hymenobacter sp. BT664]|uniref:T9SS type A sorting domain-containing protein n=1 Tax=Hymenobacter montanus TaxID=2771359 RepID=A0A927BBK8_9BACT|nr:T9SS type A sorting domain-containing protein [Hymenobacter montanus]MBD2767144.1 T9SS type A sorting domain-containing protein [Hymenobacter montanus]
MVLTAGLLLNLALSFRAAAQFTAADLATELVPNGYIPGANLGALGSTVSFTFTTRVLYAGTFTVPVVRTLNLTPGLTNVVVSGAGSYNVGTGAVSLPGISIAAGGSDVVTVSFTMPNGTVVASGNVSSPNVLPVNDPQGNNASSASIAARQPQSLLWSMSATAGTFIPDNSTGQGFRCQQVDLLVSLQNGGSLPAINVVPTLTIPPGLNILSITRYFDRNISYNPATGVVTLPPIAVLRGTGEIPAPAYEEQIDVITITFTIPESSNTLPPIVGGVSSSTVDPNLSDNSSTITIQPVTPTADLRTAPTGPASVMVGQPVTYTHTTTNAGPNLAFNVQRTLTLTPAPAAGTVTLPTGATYSAATGVVTFAPLAQLNATNVVTSTISFPMPNAPVTVTSNVGSCVRTDNNVPNNSASITTQVLSPLPVELQDFAAVAVARDAVLSWTTASELDNDRFEIERSFDAHSFERVGSERGQGSSTRPTDYRFTDAGAGRQGYPLVYYRLRQVDGDGQASWSPVRVVKFTSLSKATVGLYPNPAPGRTTLDLTGLPAGAYQVRILDLTGREVGMYELEGAGKHSLSVEGLLPGAYVVRVVGPAGNLALSLVRD